MQPAHDLARYERLRQIGEGGMGTIFEARDRETGASVALKQLRLFSPEAAVRMDREIRLLRRLEHPHIVKLLDSGRDAQGAPWLAMELLEGHPLDHRLAKGPLPLRAVLELGAQLCDALAYSHSHGVVHRDLKPANLFLRAGTDSLVLLDFGIARAEGTQRITATAAPLGTWAYMSPEQARGEPDVGPLSDLWSAAVVLLELLVGYNPFAERTAQQCLLAVLLKPLPVWHELLAGVPDALSGALAQLLVRDPSQRKGDARALGSCLRALLSRTLLDASVPTWRPSKAPASSTAEPRPTLVLLLRGAREPALLRNVATQLEADCVELQGERYLLMLGQRRWRGDEGARATRLLALLGPSAQGCLLAMLRMGTGDDGTFDAFGMEHLVHLAERDGAWATPEAAGILGDAAGDLDEGAHPIALRRLRSGPTAAPADAAPPVSRDAEVALLLEEARRAFEEQRVSLALVVASVGGGKSTFASWCASRLQRESPGVRVLLTHGESHRAQSPYGVLRELLVALEPALGAVVDDALAPGPHEEEPQVRADKLQRAVLSALQGACDAGLVLLVDDAHWIDRPSARVLASLREAELPLALWLFARPEAREQLGPLEAPDLRIELHPFRSTEAQRCLEALWPDALASQRDALLERAGGHPLTLHALVAAARAGRDLEDGGEEALGSARLTAALMSWIDACSDAARDYAKRAAVAGRSFAPELVAALGGTPEALSELRQHGLLVVRGGARGAARSYALRSEPLVGLLRGLWSPPALRALHGQVASWLEANANAEPAERAAHWEAAGDGARAQEAWVAAAERSARALDVDAALAHAARALERQGTPPRLALRARTACDEVLQLAGKRDAQRANSDAMLALARNLGGEALAEVLWRRAYMLRLAGERSEATELAREAREFGGRWAVLATIELAYLRVPRGELEPARALCALAVEESTAHGDRWGAARALAAAAFVEATAGNTLAAYACFDDARARFHALGDRRRVALIESNRASLLLDLGRVHEAREAAEAAREASRRVGNARTAAAASLTLALALRLQGELARAGSLLEEVRHAASAMQHPSLGAAAGVEQAWLALSKGAAVAVSEEALLEEARRVGGTSAELAARAVCLRAFRGPLREEHARWLEAALPKLAEERARFEALCALSDFEPQRWAAQCEQALEALCAKADPSTAPSLRAALRARFVLRD